MKLDSEVEDLFRKVLLAEHRASAAGQPSKSAPNAGHRAPIHAPPVLSGDRHDAVLAALAGLSLDVSPLDDAKPLGIASLPAEILVRIFGMTLPTGCTTPLKGAAQLARLSHVCRQWYTVAQAGALWRAVCEDLWREDVGAAEQAYQGDWKRMLMQRPRIRCDGIYI